MLQDASLIHIPDNQAEIRLLSIQGREALSELFCFNLEIDSFAKALLAEEWLNKELSFKIKERLFHGVISEFTKLNSGIYCLKLVPSLWQLNLRKESRVFERKTVLELIEELFKGYAVDFSLLKRVYAMRPYCIQYDETLFEFSTRLLAEEGIYYFFQSEENRDSLVLMDQASNHYYESPLYHSSESEDGYLLEWSEFVKHAANRLTTVDYNFSSPEQNLSLTKDINSVAHQTLFEQKTYPGNYQDYARAEELLAYKAAYYARAGHLIVAKTCLMALKPNMLIELHREPKKYYLITEISYRIKNSAECRILCSNALQFFAKIPEKNVIPNAQLAEIAGKELGAPALNANAELSVQFSWDSAEIPVPARVAYWQASKDSGMQFSARVGDKVLVYFMNGDPERPIVWGALQSEDQEPLYDLDTSGFRSANGERFNELRLNDNPEQAVLAWKTAGDFQLSVMRDKYLNAEQVECEIAQGDYAATVGKVYELHAKNSIELKVGESFVTLTADKITLAAREIKLN